MSTTANKSSEATRETAHQQEAADNRQLKALDDTMVIYKEQEAEIARKMVDLRDSMRVLREKRSALFERNENRAVERRKAGLIECSSCY